MSRKALSQKGHLVNESRISTKYLHFYIEKLNNLHVRSYGHFNIVWSTKQDCSWYMKKGANHRGLRTIELHNTHELIYIIIYKHGQYFNIISYNKSPHTLHIMLYEYITNVYVYRNKNLKTNYITNLLNTYFW